MQREEDTRKIAALNDRLRSHGAGGEIYVTSGIHALGTEFVDRALAAIRSFDAFTPDNDPYGEHDFGALEISGKRLFFKIDYYDPTRSRGSDDPTGPAQTLHVLTITLAEEY